MVCEFLAIASVQSLQLWCIIPNQGHRKVFRSVEALGVGKAHRGVWGHTPRISLNFTLFEIDSEAIRMCNTMQLSKIFW